MFYRISTNHTTPSDFSLLNKSIRGLHIANCALGFEFLFPNDVGTLSGWLDIFTKKPLREQKGKTATMCLFS